MSQHKGIAVLTSVLLTVAASMAQSSAVQPRITQAVDERQLVRLAGSVHPLAQAQYDRGAAPDDMPLQRMHLVLKRTPAQETTLRQLISDMHRPGSASYHKWLTPEQFGEQFGPSDQDIATISSWLGSHGFQVTKVQPGKQVLEFSGNVAQMRDAFHTQIHKYVVNGETHHANAGDPQIPAALAPVVGGFVSLNNFRIRNAARVLGKATYDPQTHTAQPGWTYGTNQAFNLVVAPADFAIQYDLNPLYSSNPAINGTGQTIAVVNESNINVEFVNLYRSLFGLSANPPQIIIDGNDPGIDGINNPDGPNFASGEAYLDVELAGAVAPAATVDLVIAADTALAPGLILAAEHAVFGNIAPILSLSFIGCEAGNGSGNAFISGLWEQAAAQGISVLVAAGDSGSAGCDDFNTQAYAVNGLGVNGLASTPFDVAVGGTDFFYSDYNNPNFNTQLGTYWNTTASQFPQASIKGVIPEQPFNSSQYGLDANDFFADFGTTTIFAGSGGASACATGTPAVPLQVGGTCAGYQKPPWQTGAGVPNDGVRDLPDVSLFAAGDSNFSFYPICAVDGDCQTPTGNNLVQISGVSGTSASVQAFAGIMALVNQKYGRQGQANFVLYPLKAQFPAAFHDVTNGTNSVPCEFAPNLTPNCISVTSPIMVTDPILGQVTEGQIGSGSTGDYAAAAGYNLATGLGTIDANVLVTDWGNIKFAGTTVNLTSPTAGTNVSHGTSVNFAGTVSGDATPTGSVAIETDGVVPVNPSQSTAVLPLSGTGSFSALINYLPGGTYNVWASYGGDGTNAASSSPKVQITVTPEASTTAFNVLNQVTGAPIVSGASNILYGTQLILDAQPVPTTCVNANNCSTANFTTPTGTVTFSDSGSVINTAVVNSIGEAEFNHSWSIGQHSVTAAYSGDASYNASNASAITFSIAKDPPVIFLSSSALLPSGNVQGGQATVFTIQVENSTGQVSGFSNLAAPPTGNVGLTGLPPGVPTSAVLQPGIDPSTDSSEGVATITAPANTPAGTYNNVKINYNGDSNYSSASAGPFSVTIAGLTGLASTTAASTTGSISPTTSITVNGTVTGQSGHGAPTGAVLFFSSGFVLFQVPISPGTAPSVASSFSATLNSQNLLQGANLITVQYLGDAVYSESSTTLSVASPLSDFSMVPMATIVPVSGSGSVAMDTVNVYSVNGFSGMVSFTCAPAFGIACPSPSAVTLSSGGKAAITLNISASGPSFAVSGPAMPVSVAAGSSGAATVTVTPSGGGTATGNNNILLTATAGSFVHTLAIDAFVLSPVQAAVQVSCPPATLPPGVTCPNPLNLTVTSSGAVMGQLTVNVAAPSQAPATAELLPATRTEYASLQGGPRSRNGWWKLSAGTGLAAVFLFFLPGRRRYRTTLGLWLICVLSFAMGCGGGGSGGGGGGPAATTTKITAPVTKAAKGTGLNFTVNVTLVSSGTPGGNGNVQLLDGGNVVTTVAAANGVANFTNITSLSVGTHAISANYQGDASTAASQSGNVNVTVTGTTTVGISTSPASSNNNVTFNLTIS